MASDINTDLVILASRKQLRWLNDLSFQVGKPVANAKTGEILAETKVQETGEIISHFDLDATQLPMDAVSALIARFQQLPSLPATGSQISRALKMAEQLGRSDVSEDTLAGQSRRQLDTLNHQLGGALRAARAEAAENAGLPTLAIA